MKYISALSSILALLLATGRTHSNPILRHFGKSSDNSCSIAPSRR